jgi:choline monooxygenase
VLLGVHRDHAFAIVLMPRGPERTRERIALHYATADTDPALRARNAAQWRAVFEEDLFVVEGMQRGRHAPGFDGGRFSPAMDGPTHCFHAWVAGRLTPAA